ncbi:MAG: ABC transporter ATP-binding protein [Candidatus Methanofastidiosa archaeon]|nr:ABC transporter ATP-binding protein [Candidatus Methanofastidiosa archaeon]
MKEVIKVLDATFSYNGTAKIFDGITFSMKEGDIFCILGSNGTGKSTLIKCIANLLKLKKGNIILNNRSIYSLKKEDVAKEMGYIPQMHNSTFPFSVLDVVLMGRSPHLSLMSSPSEKDYKIAEDAIKTLGISHLTKKPYTEISGGERQRVTIARALAQQPKILLLDEPTLHLDINHQLDILEMTKKLAKNNKIIVILVSHDINLSSRYSDKLILLQSGKICAIGKPEDVITKENMRNIYNIEVEMKYDSEIKPFTIVPLRTYK